MHMPSFSTVFTAVLAASPLVAAHGKIAVATGDAGGNGTALGIQGGIIPGAGRNKVTEPDTTVFKGKNADACGQTKGVSLSLPSLSTSDRIWQLLGVLVISGIRSPANRTFFSQQQQGQNDVESGTKQAMALSGNTLPQVSPGGSLSGTLHIVTSDGAGPYKAMINTDGTATSWTQLDVTTQVPGKNGNIRKTDKRWWARALQSAGLMKRATNINEDFPFQVAMPADMKCTGTIAGQSNTCIVKLVNPSNAGPFGGCVPVQQAGAGNATAARRAVAFEG